MLRHFTMVRSKITYYAMLAPKRCYEIQQQIRAREAARAARVAVGLPPDLPELEEEEERPGKEEEEQEMAPMKAEEAKEEEEEAEEPDQQVPAFNMEQAEAEFAVAQSDEMAEQQDEAYVKANRAFLQLQQAETDALFDELGTEIEAEEAGAEQPKEPELQLPPMMLELGTEIVVVFDEE